MYHSEVAKRHALVAQLDRVSDYESEGLGFESLRAHQEASRQARFFRLRIRALFVYHDEGICVMNACTLRGIELTLCQYGPEGQI